VKNFMRPSLWIGFLLVAGCGGGGGGGGGDPLPGPTPPQGPVITSPTGLLPTAALNQVFNPVTFTATGTPPITWAVSGGTITPGLTLSTDGVLSGTPTSAGLFSFTVSATDVNGVDTENLQHVVSSLILETESNDAFAMADPFEIGMSGSGVVTAGDVDYWTFEATAGQVIKTELFAVRREFGAWDSNFNRPRLTLIGPNGTDYRAGHDYDSTGTAGWTWGNHDLDIPLFRIPATGTYYARIEARLNNVHGGTYVLRMTDLGLSTQPESEDNDSPATANAVAGGLIHATREDGDDDYFAFTISEPTLVSFEVIAYRNGVFGVGGSADDDYFAPEIEIIGTDESTVLAANRGVFFSDPALHYHLVTPGTYFLRVTESSTGSDGDGEYFVAFTETPVGSLTESEPNGDATVATAIAYGDVVTADMADGLDADFYSFSGTAGDIVRVFWFEFGASETAGDFVNLALLDGSGPVQSAVSFTSVTSQACLRAILPATGTYYLRVQPENGATSYAFQLTQFKDAAFETEANDTPATAGAFSGSGRVAGAIGSPTDIDVFSFLALTDEVVTFSIYAGPGFSSNGFGSHARYTSPGAALLPTIEVVDASGTPYGITPYEGIVFSGESVTNGLATLELTFVAPSFGTYFVRVAASDGAGDADHRYVLERRRGPDGVY
jgi:hypothetical protein